MSQPTGKKFAKFGIAAALLAAAAIPASLALSGQAFGDEPPAVTTATATAGTVDQARISAGRDLFTNWGCTACHTLADAKSNGAVGPSFDGDTGLSDDFIKSRLTNGQGAMPAFGGQLTPKEISDLAYYLMHVKK